MLESLKSRSLTRLPDEVRFTGRVLFLADDADAVRQQLAGEDLAEPVTVPLRDQISTDEITPAYICYFFDETLGDFPYLGLRTRTGDGRGVSGHAGLGEGGGFVCSVAGKRRGKGSSREQAPYAELWRESRWWWPRASSASTTRTARTSASSPRTDFGIIDRIRARRGDPAERVHRR